MKSVSCVDILTEQNELVQEAALVFAYKSDACSYGTLSRQNVFSCLTCAELYKSPIGLCYSCHISCHTTHQIIPIDLKRNFSCDCGIYGNCFISKNSKSHSNTYNHNFQGKFCSCDSLYDENQSTMYQCLICEDWFHDHCLLQDPPNESEEYICSGCVTAHPFLIGYSGNTCFKFSMTLDAKNSCPFDNDLTLKGNMDLILLDNYKSSLCKCKKCLKHVQDSNLEFLMEQEDIWTPEVDPKAAMDPFELGVEQLSRIDRTMAIEGMHAFEELKQELYEKLLIPSMKNNQVVSEDQIRDFFEQLMMVRKGSS